MLDSLFFLAFELLGFMGSYRRSASMDIVGDVDVHIEWDRRSQGDQETGYRKQW